MNTQDEFTSLVLDGHSWFQQSEQFLFAAEALIPNLKRKRPIAQDSDTLAIGSLKATLLLLAVSVENALKAVKAKRGEISINNGRIDTKCFGTKSGHNLLELAQSISLALEPKEVELLTQLTEVVLWAGKYQQPLRVDDFGRSRKKNPRTLTVPHDVELVKGVLEKVRNIIYEHP